MNSLYFETALFKFLHSHYNITEYERSLSDQNIKPLPNTAMFGLQISKYFRLMNPLDDSVLSVFDKRYIAKFFRNEADIEKSWNNKRALAIYKKVIRNITSRPKGYTVYRYDGTCSPLPPSAPSFSSTLAPNNYITFGLYYTQFDENTQTDDFRNQRIVNRIANQMQQYSMAIVVFSEVDVYKSSSRFI